MAIKLNEDELIIYSRVNSKLTRFFGDFIENNLDEMVRQEMVEHIFTNENNIPLGSVGIDSMAHRIEFNLKSKFKV